ncbi:MULTISPECIES: HPr family phosphocarrier protein [Shewanella]|jgi:phosphocarrier protein NPr|uniref:HPr family phosphocarrier protein n=2 Tax=Shewanella TaxID=22 RepID=A0A6G7LND1_9GAMM|nr:MULTISPECIES: HPr family phosphocarrier protein [Shewanella]MBZ4678034.1 phosphate transporter permease [Shewanella sp.]MCA0948684.1 HPr family phosphocarrier protein [Shewanella chilikensis]MCE9786322.1 HPr family phosphocarrier protein [Shewanella chilikensis]MCE9792456.1 HPr family phosphocarrier protein [Shewanella indica]MCE9850894.1 HPr family phosphocarrier protein [Shewanella chilikensis]
MAKVEREVTIVNKLGLHARAATKLAVLASEFEADITLIQGEKKASAASVLGLLMLETGQGKTIRLIAEGPDAEPAMDAICALINARFDEAS